MTKAIYPALGINLEGEKELLGLWVAQTEGSKFWLTVFNDLKSRGLQDCFIACVDGLKGLPEAIKAVFPHTQVQLCIVHKLRNSFKYVPWKERKAVATDLRAVYAAATQAEAEQYRVVIAAWTDYQQSHRMGFYLQVSVPVYDLGIGP